MKTLAQGARDMELAAAALRGAVPVSAVSKAALLVKQSTKGEMDKITSSGRFSHVGKSGAAVGVSFTVKPGASATALVRATGPWQLVENDTKPHTEFSRSVGKLGRRADGLLDRSKAGRREARERLLNAVFGGAGAFAGAKALKLPGGIFRYRVTIPRIPGRHPWSHGVDKALPLVEETMRAAVVAPLRGIFR